MIVTSMGWGHGPYGFHVGGFAEGPWPTYPDTPGFPHTTDVVYDVRPFVFEDGTEVHVQAHRVPGQSTTYVAPATDPTWQGAVASWHTAAGGRRDRFVVLDHYAGTFYVSRFQDSRLTRTRGPGNRPTVPPVRFRMEREIQYADVVLADQPLAYWPLREGLESNTAADVVGSSHLVMLQQSWVLRPESGPLVTWTGSTSAFYLNSAMLAHGVNTLALDVRTGSLACEFWFRTSTMAGPAGMYLYDKSASAIALGLLVRLTTSGEIAARLDTLGLTSTTSQHNDGRWHHLVVRAVRSQATAHFLDCWLDNTLIGSRDISTVSGDDLQSLGALTLGMNTFSANPYLGHLAEVAVYNPELPLARVAEHYMIGVRVRG